MQRNDRHDRANQNRNSAPHPFTLLSQVEREKGSSSVGESFPEGPNHINDSLAQLFEPQRTQRARRRSLCSRYAKGPLRCLSVLGGLSGSIMRSRFGSLYLERLGFHVGQGRLEVLERAKPEVAEPFGGPQKISLQGSHRAESRILFLDYSPFTLTQLR